MDVLVTTHAWCRPPDNRATPIAGGQVWDAPACREAYFAHRVELEAWPADVDAAFATWDAHHAGKGIGRRYVTAELPLGAPWPAVRERWAPTRMWGMVHDGPRPEPSATALPVAPITDLDALVAMAARQHPEFGEGYPLYLRWLYGGLHAAGGTTWAAWHGAVPVALATHVPGPAGTGRFQEIVTDGAWRRRGACTALVTRALAEAGGASVLATVVDSDAERLYTRLGFRRASKFVELSTPTEAAVTGARAPQG